MPLGANLSPYGSGVPILLVIALGGVVGSLGRFGIDELLGGWDSDQVPWATLTVNLVGCLAIGILAPLLARGSRAWVRPFAITGVLGGFTTFSALALETGVLLDSGRILPALGYVAVTIVAGLLAVRLGVLVAEGRS